MTFACTDACCAINLIKGEALELVGQLSELTLCMQGLVEDEIGDSYQHVEKLAANGKMKIVSGDTILASEVNAIATKYNIGLGESECIVIARKLGCSVASDDKKARQAAAAELGESRVVGTLGLLRSAVREALISSDLAMKKYEDMRSKGGFLPKVSADFFEKP